MASSATFGRRRTEHQGGAGRRIDLALVVSFGDFNIPVLGAQAGAGLLEKTDHQIDAKRIITRLEQDHLFGEGCECRILFRRETGGPYDLNDRCAPAVTFRRTGLG